MSLERLIAYERLTPPGEQLGVLVEPPADTIVSLVATDQTTPLQSAALLDTSVAKLRQQLRQRLELATPVILTGHQVEFGHAGVFAKTVAVDALAARFGGAGAYVAVDFDLPKTTRLVVPRVEEGEVRQEPVPIPGCDPQLPAEWQPHIPIEQWRDFFEHITEITGNDDSLVHDYAEGFRETKSACQSQVGQASGLSFDRPEAGPPASSVRGSKDNALSLSGVIERGHAAVNRVLGLADPHRLLASQLSRTPEFRALLAHLMLNASSFADHYNEAQQAYRARRHVRNPHRPVPLLSRDGARVELPFWVSRSGQPRQRFSVARQGDRIVLFAAGESLGSETTSRLRSAASHAEPWQIEHDGWHVRPRALTLSAFIRLFLSDLFVHGIGGAKYDEMTEDFIRRFFGVDLPPACCVSATAYLPLPRQSVDRRALAAARHARRDLRFNPQRHLSGLPQALLDRREELIRASQRLRQPGPANRAERRRVFDRIRAVNQELRCHDASQVATLEQRWHLTERQYRSDLAALDREYFFALHPRRTMEELVQRVRARFGDAQN